MGAVPRDRRLRRVHDLLSFAYETVRLWETGEPVLAAGHAASNLAAGLGGVALAWAVVGLL